MQIVAFTAVWGCNDMTRLGCLKRGKWPGSRLSYVRRTVEHRPVDCGCTHADRLRAADTGVGDSNLKISPVLKGSHPDT